MTKKKETDYLTQ